MAWAVVLDKSQGQYITRFVNFKSQAKPVEREGIPFMFVFKKVGLTYLLSELQILV